MIDWMTKLPDSAIGTLLAGAAWFGFNYGVLADRAMQHELVEPAQALCQQAHSSEAPNVSPRSGIGSLLGIPELDELESRLTEIAAPPPLSGVQRVLRCSCAIGEVSELRFDYAIHTASFRIIPAVGVTEFRQRVANGAAFLCS